MHKRFVLILLFLAFIAGCSSPNNPQDNQDDRDDLLEGSSKFVDASEIGTGFLHRFNVSSTSSAVAKAELKFKWDFHAGIDKPDELAYACAPALIQQKAVLPTFFLPGDGPGNSALYRNKLAGARIDGTEQLDNGWLLTSFFVGEPEYLAPINGEEIWQLAVGYAHGESWALQQNGMNLTIHATEGNISVEKVAEAPFQCRAWPHELDSGVAIANGDTYHSSDSQWTIPTSAGIAFQYNLYGAQAVSLQVIRPDGSLAINHETTTGSLEGWFCEPTPGDWIIRIPELTGSQTAGLWSRLLVIDAGSDWNSALPCD